MPLSKIQTENESQLYRIEFDSDGAVKDTN